MKLLTPILLSSFILMMFSCESPTTVEEEITSFDRQKMLIHWADDIIIPSLEEYGANTQHLKSATENFIINPTEITLSEVRSVWHDTYVSFQHAGPFVSLGKGDEKAYRLLMNIYPTSSKKIENHIANGDYDLSLLKNYQSVGLPALEYMFYGLGESDQEILHYYTTAPNMVGYLTYLKDLVDQTDLIAQEILAHWKGDYRHTFVNATDNSYHSSIPKMVNDFVNYVNRDFLMGKIGLPIGHYSEQPQPDRVEAYFKGDISKQLALESLNALQEFFNGKKRDHSGLSLAAYLDHHDVKREGVRLSELINAQFEQCRLGIILLQDDFRKQIAEDLTAFQAVYDDFQQLAMLLQIDMMLAMDIYYDDIIHCDD